MLYWFKSCDNFDEWVDFVYWWSCIGKGLRLQPAQLPCVNRPQMDPALNNWAICLGLGSLHWKHHCVYMRLASRWHDSLVCPVVSGVTRKAVATEFHLTDITRKVVASEFNQHE